MNKQLTSAELTAISELLKEASEEYSNHGCNDYQMANTEENKAMLIDVVKFAGCDEEEQAEEIKEITSCKKKKLFIMDWLLMDYLADRCKEVAKK